ncbi:MAG: DUF551 domain-containing protein [Aristaeellaceae bacterium]
MKTLREQSQEAVERMMSVDDMISRDWVLKRMVLAPDADVVKMAPAVEAEPVWINVHDAEPEEGTPVLTIARHTENWDAISQGITAILDGEWLIPPDLVITHWMPLPEPPKEDNHE